MTRMKAFCVHVPSRNENRPWWLLLKSRPLFCTSPNMADLANSSNAQSLCCISDTVILSYHWPSRSIVSMTLLYQNDSVALLYHRTNRSIISMAQSLSCINDPTALLYQRPNCSLVLTTQSLSCINDPIALLHHDPVSLLYHDPIALLYQWPNSAIVLMT